ncbi:MAG TPA: hypothetical protein VMM92_08880 [Thermoanaerobaculia bacterium]|nr:hypothetical protein [Thermoanaerobaculia bacterium]
MTDGFEAAKAQRNALERLGAMIPGYRGFQDRELRRDVDRLEREHLCAELTRLKGALRDQARPYTEGGHLAALGGFDRLDREIDGLSQAIRFSDYGATGLFDAVKVGEPELARLYEFDLSVLNDLSEIESGVAGISGDDPAAALEQLRGRVRALADKWKSRSQVIGSVVQTRQA